MSTGSIKHNVTINTPKAVQRLISAIEEAKNMECSPVADITTDNFGVVCASAVKYALGCQSCAPHVICNVIRPMIPCLSRMTVKVMIEDIEAVDDYGGDFNKDLWMELLDELRK